MLPVRYISLFVLLFILPEQSQAQTWVKKHAIPWGGSDGCVAVTIGNNVYFGGGGDGTFFYQYNPSADTWTKKASLPSTGSVRAFSSAFSLNGKGYFGFGQQVTSSQQSVSNDFWSYDTALNKWTSIAPFPGSGRDGAIAFAVAGKGFVGGGADASGNEQRDFYSYDPANNSWKRLNDMPESAVFFASTFVIGDSGYLATGSYDTIEFSDAFSYDPSTDTWNQIASYPGHLRQAAVGFSVAGIGYVGLGMSQYTSVFSDLYSYDPKTGAWSAAGTYPEGPIAWVSAATDSNSVYIGTGWNFGPTFSNAFWQFNPVSGESVAATNSRSETELSVQPNPFRTATNVSVHSSQQGATELTVRDILGRVVYKSKEVLNSGGETTSFSLDADQLHLQSGVYILSANIGNESISRQLVVTR